MRTKSGPTQIDALVRELAADCARAAKDAGYKTGSYAFNSYLRGAWKVIASAHPQLMTHKIAFLDVAGVSK